MKKAFFTYLFTLSAFASAQTLSSSLDKKTLTLGEPDVYKINIDNLGGKDVVSAPKNELLPFHFEEISDAVKKDTGRYERTIEFSVFQEGKFTIPAFDIKIGTEVYHTIPYEVEVLNPAQQGDQIHDIMQNKEVSLGVRDYWQLYKWYILGILILLALVFVIWQIIRYGSKRRSAPVVMTNRTLKELDALLQKKYLEKEDFRSFYVELIDISRRFLSEQYKMPAEVLLTDDLVTYMKQNHTISEENERVVEEVFLRGDMVKFAKILPDADSAQRDFSAIREFVKRSSKDLEFENLRKDV